ncbi:hypothetical protein [Roseiconus lacunae]|uniref:hypothetical protein n=1 Tax=Roseiconus lacunae TaxID=2605694 RepID=UPI0028F45726|nr:hypothetical protein [Roseiconus lacunae]
MRTIFDDSLDLRAVGRISIERGSYVEPNFDGQWTADLSVVDGPVLGPYDKRSDALAAEVTWLNANWVLRQTD